jgi:amino acid transporter
MKRDNDKSHLYITTVAALVMLVFCMIQGYDLFHTVLVVIITIVSFYLISRIAIGIVKRAFFKPPPKTEAAPEAEDDGGEDDGEVNDEEKYEIDDESQD